MRRASLAIPLVGALFALACESAEPLGWEIEIRDGDVLSRTVVIVATIREGGCFGDELYSEEIRRTSGELETPPVLEDGTYGFRAEAHDAACIVIAEGCEEIVLPEIGPVVTLLSPAATERPACGPSRCSDGSCETGSGPVDGGTTRTDGGPRTDGGGGGADSGCASTSELVCTDGRDDDCDGDLDCDDSDCASSPSCVDCGGAGRCPACQACVSDVCMTIADSTPCPGGTCVAGACCAGCIDSSSGSPVCAGGTDPTACGASGAACDVCNPCESCGPGGCAPAMMGSVCMDPSLGPGRCGGAPLACCTGCLMAGTCHPGTLDDMACGLAGGTCRDCTATGATCSATGTCM